MTHRLGRPTTYWTFARYLSPRLTFFVKTRDAFYLDTWRGQAAEAPVEAWPASHIWTSYRRELDVERRIEAKIVRIADNLSTRAVPVYWASLADFRAGRFEVNQTGFMLGSGRVSPAVLDRCRAKPGRAMQLVVGVSGVALGCLPLEQVPDRAWGDVPKPKWAQAPR